MADTDAIKEGHSTELSRSPKKFYEDVPVKTPGFFLKGTCDNG